MTNEIIVRAQTLSAGYGSKVIIGNADFSVSRGEILTLIGPNGAGKSTILKTIAGQLEAVGGAVYINGADIRNINGKELAKTLSIVMTQRIEPELMTCRDVVNTGRYPYTGQLGILSEHDREKVSEAMELTSTHELAEREFDRISDGQRQRVMLARAICQEPDVLVLDEPTSFLDIRHKLELLNTLKKLVRDKNIAVIMSLHELELAQRISDNVICINDGKIDRSGAPEDIFSGDYISRLYGIPPESRNEFTGSVELERVTGKPQVFVIAGGGSGSETFRRLQREGIPFAAGILYENDIDFPTAKALAAEVIAERAFEPVGDDKIIRAKALINECGKVICCVEKFGTLDKANEELFDYSKMLITDQAH